MGRTAEEYYAEKLQRLIALQEQQKQTPQLNGSRPRPQERTDAAPKAAQNRAYYEGFRTRMQTPGSRPGQASRQTTAQPSAGTRRSSQGTPRQGTVGRTGGGTSRTAAQSTRPTPGGVRKAPPRQERETLSPEDLRSAAQSRRRRKLREALISAVLVTAVLVVLCVVTYQLLFVIRNLDAIGSDHYSAQEIVAASGVHTGEHLYSFSSRATVEAIMLGCPYIVSTDVQRTPPGTITFTVTEEAPAFYAKLYGEFWEISSTLRVLEPISEADAKAQGLVRLKLPAIRNAMAGRTLEFENGTSGKYVVTVLDALQNAKICAQVTMVDLRNAYDIEMHYGGKYQLKFGNYNVIENKLEMAAKVIDDFAATSDEKAKIDLSDPSVSGVTPNNQLVLE